MPGSKQVSNTLAKVAKAASEHFLGVAASQAASREGPLPVNTVGNTKVTVKAGSQAPSVRY